MTAPVASIPQPGFWQRRVQQPILAQLRQGITPREIALTLALGLTLGIFPILGATTLLCAVVGFWLRLNQPIIQLANYFAYPLQLALLLPFYRCGETLFSSPHVPIFSVTDLAVRFQASPSQFLIDYGAVGAYGVVVWALCAPLLALAVYAITRPILQRLDRRADRP